MAIYQTSNLLDSRRLTCATILIYELTQLNDEQLFLSDDQLFREHRIFNIFTLPLRN